MILDLTRNATKNTQYIVTNYQLSTKYGYI